MELREALRTTFSAREFTDEDVPDEVVARLLDDARFAASGGNRQPWRVLVVRDRAAREAIVAATIPAAKRYVAQRAAGESPWSSVRPTAVSDEAVERATVPAALTEPVLRAPVVLVVCADLSAIASVDQELDRVGLAGGASIYPFAWSILLAARGAGLGGTLTTLAVADEPALQRALGLPEHVAVAGIIPLGRPVRPLTRLSRRPVAEFARRGRWDGPPLVT